MSKVVGYKEAVIELGDIVETKDGRLHKVTEIRIDQSGTHYCSSDWDYLVDIVKVYKRRKIKK